MNARDVGGEVGCGGGGGGGGGGVPGFQLSLVFFFFLFFSEKTKEVLEPNSFQLRRQRHKRGGGGTQDQDLRLEAPDQLPWCSWFRAQALWICHQP